MPLSGPLIAAVGRARALQLALAGGDDYELCFTVPPALVAALEGLPCTAIGRLTTGRGVAVLRGDSVIEFSHSGFDHFAG